MGGRGFRGAVLDVLKGVGGLRLYLTELPGPSGRNGVERDRGRRGIKASFSFQLGNRDIERLN